MVLTTRQVWSYGAGDLGVALLYVAVNTHFFYFLVNVAGFGAVEAGAVFVLGRLVDAVTDPLIGAASDGLRHSLGRLPFLRRALLPTGLAFVGLFALPLSPVAPLACAVAGSVLFSVAYTCVLMPYLALLPELVVDYDARTRAIGIKSVFTMLATLVAVASPPAIVIAIDGASALARSTPGAWVAMAAILAASSVPPLLLVAYGVSEPARGGGVAAAPAARAGLLAELRSAWRTEGLPQVVYLFLAVTVGLMIANSLLTFYLESVLRLPGETLPRVLAGLVLASILALPLWIALARRLGKRGALAAALALASASLLALVAWVPSGEATWRLAVVTSVNGAAVGGVTMLPWAMLPDVVELDELATGRRREGLLYAAFTFGQKLASSVGVFANAIVIAAFGYVPGMATQSPQTVDALRAMMGPGAVAVFAVAIWLTWRYPVSRARHTSARAALRPR